MFKADKLPNSIYGIILDDQGGQQITVRTDGKSPTLRAEAHGNIPCVMAVDGYNGAVCDMSPTLGVNCGISTGRNGVVYAIENHPADSRVNIDGSGKCQTLTSRMGTGGNNVPMVMEPFCKSRRAKSPDDATTWKHAKVANTLNTFDQGEARANELVVCVNPKQLSLSASTDVAPTLVETQYKEPPIVANRVVNLNKDDVQSKAILDPVGIAPSIYAGEKRYGGGECYVLDKVYCLQGNGIDRADTAGCNGRGWCENVGYTLNTIDRPAICYTVDQGAGKSSVSIQEDKSPTLACTHDGAPVVAFEPGVMSRCGGHIYINKSGTIRSIPGDNQMTIAKEEKMFWDGTQTASTLTARDAGGGQRMPDKDNFTSVMEKGENEYVVRRLTPLECSRLQGFPDGWANIDRKDDFPEDECNFWREVRRTFESFSGREQKEYTKEQMLKWYNGLHTDSAEYKMWGNGIALPTALYVMQGIADVLNER